MRWIEKMIDIFLMVSTSYITVQSLGKIEQLTPAVLNFLALLKGWPLLKQEAQLMLTTGSTRLAVSRGQQTWYHFGSIATSR